jgi:ribosome-associated translation inhibitor RaiA
MENKPVDTTGFALEFYNEVQELGRTVEDKLRTEAEGRLRKLMQDHTDLTGAAVALERPAERASAYLYRAHVVVHARPENIAGIAQAGSAEGALKEALNAVERQVRETRKKLHERYSHS